MRVRRGVESTIADAADGGVAWESSPSACVADTGKVGVA